MISLLVSKIGVKWQNREMSEISAGTDEMEHESKMRKSINTARQIQHRGSIVSVDINMNGNWTRKDKKLEV